MRRALRLRRFVSEHGRPSSEMLGIRLKIGETAEISKWFLASILYAKPIRESTATATYMIFENEGVVSPKEIVEAGWEGLVSLLDEGGYTRYDFSTASKLLTVFKNLQERYDGDLNRLHSSARDGRDLERRLMALGKGIGPTTVSIFLREMRCIWRDADPEPSALVGLAMRELGIRDLKKFAKEKNYDLVRLETALLRLGKDYLRKGVTPRPVNRRRTT